MALGIIMLFASCDKDNQAVQHLFLTSSSVIEASAEGETVTLSYNLTSPVEGKTVKAKVVSGEEMLGNITHPATGIIRIEVKQNSGDKREAIVEISYINETTSVIIEQAAGNGNNGGGNNGGNQDEEVVEFTALSLDGYYYGEKYGEGSDRYVIFLSRQGMNNVGQAYPNSTYYYVDAFGPVAEGGAPYSLPEGTYNYDLANTGKPYTINSENTQILQSGDTDVEYIPVTSAKMVVKGNKLTLDVVVDGVKHHVTYNGGMELEDLTNEGGDDNNNNNNNDPTGGQEKEAQSTLNSDHAITFPDTPRAKWIYEGDWWQTGYSNYTVMIMNKYNGYVTGDTLQLDLITDNTSKDGDFYGKFNCSYTPGKMVMMAGFTDTGARPVGAWYFEYGAGAGGYKNYAMLIDGWVEITDNGDGTSTVILDSHDCHGNHITCNWTGVIEED